MIAILTLTRDRLSYTEHCFMQLREMAGCEYHHYVLDQDSKDGTDHYLDVEKERGNLHYVYHAGQNLGIARGMNHLVNAAMRFGGYDGFVKFDNDCELVSPGTIKRLTEVAIKHDAIVSPVVDGLDNPPPQVGHVVLAGNERITTMKSIGGILMASPRWFWDRFRYPEDLPTWGHDDDVLCAYAASEGITVGYLQGLRCNHFRTTQGQHKDYPDYFARRVGEGGPE